MRRSVISLAAGIALAVLAVLLMAGYVSAQNKPAEAVLQKNNTVGVVVAARDLPFGATIIRDHLKFAQWPADSVPEGAFTDMDIILVDANGQGSNRVTLRPIFTGEPILAPKISGFGDKATLSRKVSEDKRAYSIRVNDVSGVAGFLSPGDKVDIILTRSASGRGNENLVTDVILQNIEILGIDQKTSEELDKPILARTITVEVTTDQAQKLALAQQVGTLTLTLRSYANNAQEPTSRISAGDLSAIVPPITHVSTGNKIRVRRGMSVE